MDFQVRWTAGTYRDLTRSVVYLRRTDPDAVEAALEPVHSTIDRLVRFPYSGDIHGVSGTHEIRVIRAGSYRIFFELDPDQKTITLRSIRHVRQQDPDFSE